MPRSRASIQTRDGLMDTQTFTPSGAGPWPGVIFYMDALGVRPEMEEMAERLAASGYFVLLPDLYYRSRPFAPFDAAAGVQYTMEVYPAVAHGFCVRGLPVYNKEASERHWKELLELFAKALPSSSPALTSV